jgi:Flp pilus assembly protein TadG
MVPMRRPGEGSERGSLSLFTAITMVGILAILALVVDGGGRLQALAHAEGTAQEAARSGAESINVGQAVSGQGITIDNTQAITAAQSYLHSAGVTGTVTLDPATNTLKVSVVDHYTPLFSFFGSTDVTGNGSATLVYQPGG